MKVVVLFGSPRKNGNTSRVVKSFMEGVKSSGNEVELIDCTKLRIGGCMSCYACMGNGGVCVQKDDYERVREAIVAADVICFASPIYYYGLSAQLKAVIDRFFAYNTQLMESNKKCALLLTFGDTDMETAQPSIMHYHAFTRYLKWNDCGVVAVPGCYELDDADKTDGPARAFELGKNL